MNYTINLTNIYPQPLTIKPFPPKKEKSLRQPGSLRTQEVFEGLTACTDYGIGLSAVTVSGFKSPEVGCNFTTAEATPSAPRGLNHTDVGAESVSLRWFAPEVSRPLRFRRSAFHPLRRTNSKVQNRIHINGLCCYLAH